METLFQESVQAFAHELDNTVPVGRTGFLRQSLMASTTGLPRVSSAGPIEGQSYTVDFAAIEAAIFEAAEKRGSVFLGYTARYAEFLEFGTQHIAPRGWVRAAVQRWPDIVENKAGEVKRQFGL
jgi:hypothetical protein